MTLIIGWFLTEHLFCLALGIQPHPSTGLQTQTMTNHLPDIAATVIETENVTGTMTVDGDRGVVRTIETLDAVTGTAVNEMTGSVGEIGRTGTERTVRRDGERERMMKQQVMITPVNGIGRIARAIMIQWMLILGRTENTTRQTGLTGTPVPHPPPAPMKNPALKTMAVQ
jgi:hypothetical protein